MPPFDQPPPDPPSPRSARARCPICGRPTQPAHRPFCSKRCADIDLHRWLSGVYRVPTREPPEDTEEQEQEKE